jgi:hypothetical protein
MDTNPDIDPELEDENAYKALEEFRNTGQSARRCLRCGGKLPIYDGGSGYRVWCENEDFSITVRGI